VAVYPWMRARANSFEEGMVDAAEAVARSLDGDLDADAVPNEPTAGPAGYAVIDARTGVVLAEHKGRQLPDLLK